MRVLALVVLAAPPVGSLASFRLAYTLGLLETMLQATRTPAQTP